MSPVSVVIITYNEEANIVDCIRSAKLLTNDIVVVDAESNDATVSLAKAEGAKTFIVNWKGYGFARNSGALQAKNNWILAIDADEHIGPDLVASINKIIFDDPHTVYKFSRKNFIGDKRIKLGTLGFERVARLYNRNCCDWDLTLVHECLQGNGLKRKLISGYLIHYGLKDFNDHRQKAELYAQMCAEKYFRAGRKSGFAKCLFSSLFNSVKSYIFQAGFLDGRQGFILAENIACYSWLKYHYLQLRYAQTKDKQDWFTSSHSNESTTEQAFSSEI